jgi:putative membrane protein
MSDTSQPRPTNARAPRVFTLDDPALSKSGVDDVEPVTQSRARASSDDTNNGRAKPQLRPLSTNDLKRGLRWGSVLLSAMVSLAVLAASLWFTRFVSVAIERNDWLGWIATGLLTTIAVALGVLLLREVIGFSRLAKLSKLRKSLTALATTPDLAKEKGAVRELASHYSGRPDAAWGLARLKDHANDVLAPGELLRLADREILAPIDAEVRRTIMVSGRRVATVTALSPMTLISVGFVLFENVRMFRTIAGLYGGRPGVFGGLRLARLVVGHIVATGGVAMTDDLLGQFLGQDVLRRLSQRLGEGAFNGALTARLGVAAVEVTRPMPFLDAEPLRVREIFAEVFRALREGKPATTDTDEPKSAAR